MVNETSSTNPFPGTYNNGATLTTTGSVDYYRTSAAGAVNTLITFDAGGNPQVDPAMVAEFHKLPAEAQQAFLARILENARNSPDAELKLAVTFLVTRLAHAGTSSAIESAFAAVLGQVDSLPPGVAPTRIAQPEVRAALARLRNNTATLDDLNRLAREGNADMSPDDRAKVATLFAGRANENMVRETIANAPSREAANQTLSILGQNVQSTDGDVYRGWVHLNMLLHGADVDDDVSANLDRTARQIHNMQTAVKSPVIAANRDAFAMARVAPPPVAAEAGAPGSAPAGNETSASDTSSAFKPIRDLSDAEKRAIYEKRLADVSADGSVSVGDQILLIHAALDPNNYYERIRNGDPELLGMLKDNPGLMETIKLTLSTLNATKDALIAIQDDMNARRKKHAEGLSRVA